MARVLSGCTAAAVSSRQSGRYRLAYHTSTREQARSLQTKTDNAGFTGSLSATCRDGVSGPGAVSAPRKIGTLRDPESSAAVSCYRSDAAVQPRARLGSPRASSPTDRVLLAWREPGGRSLRSYRRGPRAQRMATYGVTALPEFYECLAAIRLVRSGSGW